VAALPNFSYAFSCQNLQSSTIQTYIANYSCNSDIAFHCQTTHSTTPDLRENGRHQQIILHTALAHVLAEAVISIYPSLFISLFITFSLSLYLSIPIYISSLISLYLYIHRSSMSFFAAFSLFISIPRSLYLYVLLYTYLSLLLSLLYVCRNDRAITETEIETEIEIEKNLHG
jgi:hypothetical protein